MPVPGDGRYEWDGYLPIRAKPSVYNPPEGYFATANNHLTPDDYPHMDAIGFEWSDPYRWARAAEVLGSGRLHSMADMMALQTDYLSIPARTIVPMLRHAGPSPDPAVERARELLLAWDFVLDPTSVAAGIYVAFEGRVRGNVRNAVVPAAQRSVLGGMAMTKVIDHLNAPGGEFGDDPVAGRDAVLLRSLEEAVAALRAKLGGDMDAWQYGQPDYKHARIFHPLSRAAPPRDCGSLHRRPTPARRKQLHPQQHRPAATTRPPARPSASSWTRATGTAPSAATPRASPATPIPPSTTTSSNSGPTTASSRSSTRASGSNRWRPSAGR